MPSGGAANTGVKQCCERLLASRTGWDEAGCRVLSVPVLDGMPDEIFTRYGSDLSPAEMRERFRDWPR